MLFVTAAATCPRVAHTNIRSNVPTACERLMEADLNELLGSQIEARVEAMLSEVPFPQTWDFAGTRSPAFYYETARWQESQYVTLYAVFN